MVHVRVGLEEKADGEQPLRLAAVDRDALAWRAAIHGGAGRIATRHIWGADDFRSTWTFADHAILAPQSSVGYHLHEALEECFLVLRGGGYMTIEAQTFEVGPGSMTWQGIEQGHGIYNPRSGELEFLRLAVALPEREFTTVDLNDDLAGRRPL